MGAEGKTAGATDGSGVASSVDVDVAARESSSSFDSFFSARLRAAVSVSLPFHALACFVSCSLTADAGATEASFASKALRAFASPSGVRADASARAAPFFSFFAARSSLTSAAATRATALEASRFRSATGVVRFSVAALSNHASTHSSSRSAAGAWKSK